MSVEQTSEGLRTVLFQTLDDMRSGKVDPQQAKAIAALAHQIIATVSMEIAVAKLRADYPADTKLICPQPLKLSK